MITLVIAPHADDEVLGCGILIQRRLMEGRDVHVVVVCDRAYDHQHDPELAARDRAYAVKAGERLRRVVAEASSVIGTVTPGHVLYHWLELRDEQLDNAGVLPVLKKLEPLIQDWPIAEVCCPFAGDINQDHQVVARACQIVFRASQPVAQSSRIESQLDTYAWPAKFTPTVLVYEVMSSTEQAWPVSQPLFRPNLLFPCARRHVQAKIEAMQQYESESRPYPHPRSPRAIENWAAYRGSQFGYDYGEAFMLARGVW